MNYDFITRMTTIIWDSLVYNKHIPALRAALDVEDMKNVVVSILLKDDLPSKPFVKGFNLINWSAIYKKLQTL